MSTAILLSVCALAAWTGLVLLRVPIVRVRAGLRRAVAVDDFRYGESATVPPRVGLPNRHPMNLLEVPVLFHVACLILQVTRGTAVTLAWTYVALRIVHSAIHLTYNRVLHRLTAFAASNVVLAALWVVVGLHVAASG